MPGWPVVLRVVFAALVFGAGGASAGAEERDFAWPPRVGQTYPDFELLDHTGQSVRLSSFKGRVILLEPFAMNCPACQAFLGGNRKAIGPLGPIKPQSNLSSLHEMLPRYAGVRLPHPKIVYIILLLFDLQGGSPGTVEDAKKVVQHFRLRRNQHEYVLVADERFVGKTSYDMIPGFQLIDRQFILRADSTGHHPSDNLYTTLLPMVKELL